MNKKDKLIWDTIDSMLVEARAKDMDVIVHTTDSPDAFLMVNKGSSKILVIGVVPDPKKKRQYRVESVMVNMKRWRWAEDEGFTFHDIVDNKVLSSEIFYSVEAGNVNVLK
jgi:hypothetical protein